MKRWLWVVLVLLAQPCWVAWGILLLAHGPQAIQIVVFFLALSLTIAAKLLYEAKSGPPQN